MTAPAQLDDRAGSLRIIAAADAARRRIERDLHDGAQQRLIALALRLQLAHARADDDPPQIKRLLEQAIAELAAATRELRELARGIHPIVLTQGGLQPALAGLAGRAALPVTLTAPAQRLPADIEAAAYFIVAEALTNIARHAHATQAAISITHPDARLLVRVSDNGRGGANVDAGSGLLGLADRVAALGGALEITSPAGLGTTIHAQLPCAS